MFTRRHFLLTSIAALAASRLPMPAGVTVLHRETNALAVESLNGFTNAFRTILPCCSVTETLKDSYGPLLILPGLRTLSWHEAGILKREALRGRWIVLESGLAFASASEAVHQQRVFQSAFNLTLGMPVDWKRSSHFSGCPYIRYSWPNELLLRDFSEVVPAHCRPEQVVAQAARIPVAARVPLGKGGIIFLGSPLGSALFAGDAQAEQLLAGIVNSCASRFVRSKTSGRTVSGAGPLLL